MTPHPLNANKTNKGILLLSFLMIFTILLTACGGGTAAQKKNNATSLTMLGNAGGDYPRDFNPYNPSVISGTPGLVTTLAEDYVLMAEAKGLHPWRVMFTYAARNAILPNITAFALSLGFVVSGSLLTEIVFSYPGIGFAILQAVDNLDYALLQGIFLVITIAVLCANFLADLVYVLLDPRVRIGRG